MINWGRRQGKLNNWGNLGKMVGMTYREEDVNG
jgi:hypothetical protein